MLQFMQTSTSSKHLACSFNSNSLCWVSKSLAILFSPNHYY